MIHFNDVELTYSSRQLPPVIGELVGRIHVKMSISQNKSIMLIIWPQLYPSIDLNIIRYTPFVISNNAAWQLPTF